MLRDQGDKTYKERLKAGLLSLGLIRVCESLRGDDRKDGDGLRVRVMPLAPSPALVQPHGSFAPNCDRASDHRCAPLSAAPLRGLPCPPPGSPSSSPSRTTAASYSRGTWPPTSRRSSGTCCSSSQWTSMRMSCHRPPSSRRKSSSRCGTKSLGLFPLPCIADCTWGCVQFGPPTTERM